MAALTPDGARTGVNGLVIATIRENVVIIGKPISSIYSDSVYPDRTLGGQKVVPSGDFPILKEGGNISICRSD